MNSLYNDDQWTFNEKIRLIDCFLSDSNIDSIARNLTEDFGKNRPKNFFSIKNCNTELNNIIQEPFPGHLKEGLPEKYSKKQILESWMKYFQKQEEARRQFEEKMRTVKLRKVWKLIEDAREGKVSEEELNRLYEERLAKDEEKGEAYNQRVASLVKKLPTKKLFKTKNIQEVLNILNSPEKSPTKSVGSPTKSATSDWTESFDEEENEEEIPEEITGPVIPTLPNAKEIPQFHEVGEMKPQKVMKVAEEIKTEEMVTSPVKSPKVVASPEKRMLRTLPTRSRSEVSIEVSPTIPKSTEVLPTEASTLGKGRGAKRKISPLKTTVEGQEVQVPAVKRRRSGRSDVSSLASPGPIPVSPSFGERTGEITSPTQSPPSSLVSPNKDRRSSRLSEGAPPMIKAEEPMEVDIDQPDLGIKELTIDIPPVTTAPSVPSIESLGITANVGTQTNLSIRHRLPKKEHEARFSSPHRARRTSSRGKLTQHTGVQCERVMFNPDDEIHYTETGPTTPFIPSIYVGEEDEQKPRIKPRKTDASTIAEIEAERKAEENKVQPMVEEKRKLRSPTKEMKLLVKIGLEETDPSAQVKEEPVTPPVKASAKDRRSSTRQKIIDPKKSEDSPATKNKVEISQALNLISQYKESYMFKDVPTDKQAPNYSKAIKKPMSLNKMKKLIEDDTISTMADLKHYLSLMFCNAIMFNSSELEVVNAAKEMRKYAAGIFRTLEINKSFAQRAQAARASKKPLPGKTEATITPSPTPSVATSVVSTESVVTPPKGKDFVTRKTFVRKAIHTRRKIPKKHN
uniref:Bromo domain-containing protein n=1 Tax=Acrobeloides nanus TaxID=290746 RepID=A0A914E9V8_9BILA